MFRYIFRGVLCINSTSWLIVIYGIKEDWSVLNIPRVVMALMLIMIPILLTGLSILLSKRLEKDNIQECAELNLADNEFLPVSLGYFWVALSVDDLLVLIFVYIIIFVFSYLTQSFYFNPLFLLFGYHFYHVKTKCGTMIFVAVSGKVARRADEIEFKDLRRINDVTYLAVRGKKR